MHLTSFWAQRTYNDEKHVRRAKKLFKFCFCVLPVKGSGENARKEESDIFAEETKTFCDCTREISVRWNSKMNIPWLFKAPNLLVAEPRIQLLNEPVMITGKRKKTD